MRRRGECSPREGVPRAGCRWDGEGVPRGSGLRCFRMTSWPMGPRSCDARGGPCRDRVQWVLLRAPARGCRVGAVRGVWPTVLLFSCSASVGSTSASADGSVVDTTIDAPADVPSDVGAEASVRACALPTDAAVDPAIGPPGVVRCGPICRTGEYCDYNIQAVVPQCTPLDHVPQFIHAYCDGPEDCGRCGGVCCSFRRGSGDINVGREWRCAGRCDPPDAIACHSSADCPADRPICCPDETARRLVTFRNCVAVRPPDGGC